MRIPLAFGLVPTKEEPRVELTYLSLSIADVGDRVMRKGKTTLAKDTGTIVEFISDSDVKIKWDTKLRNGSWHSTVKYEQLIKVTA